MDVSFVDLAKTGVTAVAGWLAGRLQAAQAETSGRVKTQQEKLIEAVRLVAKHAIEYHCLTLDDKAQLVRAEFLKSDLWRIRSDTQALATHCCVEQIVWLIPCMNLLDAVTGFPFETVELPKVRDPHRSESISVATEKMVDCVSALRLPMLGKSFAMVERARRLIK